MNDGLTASDREKLVGLLSRFPKLEKVVLFGSRAMGTYSPASDIDLALYGDGLTLQDVAHLASEIEECGLPVEVDLIRYDTITSAPLKEHIARHGRLFHEKMQPISRSMGGASEWKECLFRDLLQEPVRNGIYKTSEFHGRGTKVINMGELFAYPRLRSVEMKRVELTESESERFSVLAGDLLFARRSLVAEGAGKCCIVLEVNEPTTFESSLIRARVDKTKANAAFLYYLFSSPLGAYHLDTILRHVAVAGITGKDLMGLRIEVPGPDVQKEIVRVLSALDDKIEENRRINETLEAMARALFKDWFVDFGPTRAKAEGRAPYLAPELWSLFPACLDGEGKPDGWKTVPLDQIAKFLNGIALQKYPARDGDFLPVIKIAELRAASVVNSDRASVKIPNEYIVEDGDVLFSWSGSLIQRVWTSGKGALNQHLFKVTSDTFPKWFYFYWIDQHMEDFRATAASKATTMGHIQRHHLTQAMTIVPTEKVLNAANILIAPLFERGIANDLEIRTLAKTRDELLPKLLSGEIRIHDAEKAIGGML